MINCIQPRVPVRASSCWGGRQLPSGAPLLQTHVVVCGTAVRESERNKKPAVARMGSGRRGQVRPWALELTPGHGSGGAGCRAGLAAAEGQQLPLILGLPHPLLRLYSWLHLACILGGGFHGGNTPGWSGGEPRLTGGWGSAGREHTLASLSALPKLLFVRFGVGGRRCRARARERGPQQCAGPRG